MKYLETIIEICVIFFFVFLIYNLTEDLIMHEPIQLEESQ